MNDKAEWHFDFAISTSPTATFPSELTSGRQTFISVIVIVSLALRLSPFEVKASLLSMADAPTTCWALRQPTSSPGGQAIMASESHPHATTASLWDHHFHCAPKSKKSHRPLDT